MQKWSKVITRDSAIAKSFIILLGRTMAKCQTNSAFLWFHQLQIILNSLLQEVHGRVGKLSQMKAVQMQQKKTLNSLR